MKQLDVFMTGELIGHLREDGGGAMAFAYSHSWLGRGDAVPLAPNLPLDEQWHDGEAVTTYFDNLLPEGSVRDFVWPESCTFRTATSLPCWSVLAGIRRAPWRYCRRGNCPRPNRAICR